MKKLTEAMKQMLDALAFAHVGNNLSLKQKSEVLDKSNYTIDKVPSVEARQSRSRSSARRVALYLGSELPVEVMDYVISTCASLKHELTILTFQSESAGMELLEPHMEALAEAGVKMELVPLTGDPLAGLARYLRGHSEIAFLTCKDSGYLGRSYLKGMQRKDLPVPVVVVTTSGEGKGTLEKTSTKNDDQAVVA